MATVEPMTIPGQVPPPQGPHPGQPYPQGYGAPPPQAGYGGMPVQGGYPAYGAPPPQVTVVMAGPEGEPPEKLNRDPTGVNSHVKVGTCWEHN